MSLPIKAGDIYSRVRFFMNDTSADEYTNDVLLAPLQIAYDDVKMECEDANIPFTNKTSAVIQVPVGVTAIGSAASNSPGLPNDLVELIEVYERPSGSNNDFSRMNPLRFLPKTSVITTYLEVYAWQNQVIQLLGASNNVEIKIDYVANTFNKATDENTEFRLTNCINALAFRTAALCAKYIAENETRSEELNGEAQRCLLLMENIGVKNQQSMPVRRRPFRTGVRYNRSFGMI